MRLGKAQIDIHEKNSEKIKYIYNQLEGEERVTVKFEDVLSDTENFIPTEEDPPEDFLTMANIVLTVITTVGMVVSVLIVAIIGIKYMIGSVEEKAEYKKDMIPYLVGAVLTFSITSIVKILQAIGESFN